jgi:aminoglycoside phosphotransferase (APT) family kinase protein
MNDTGKRPPGRPDHGSGKTADELHRQGATDFAGGTDALQAGTEAERDVENYRDEYERAQEVDRSRSPADSRQKET